MMKQFKPILWLAGGGAAFAVLATAVILSFGSQNSKSKIRKLANKSGFVESL